jgi:hypothetical protein
VSAQLRSELRKLTTTRTAAILLLAAGRFLPGQSGNALVGQVDEHLLAPGIAAAVLLGWTLAFVAAAVGRLECTDV